MFNFFGYRHIPVDMAAFAINVTFFTQNPQIRVGFQPGGKRRSKDGYMESDLIKHIGSSRKEIECRGVDNEVRYVVVIAIVNLM